jgi:hypothetical protein
MQHLQELAIEAIEARLEGSLRFQQCIDELQASGLSDRRIAEMLDKARDIVCPKQAVSAA